MALDFSTGMLKPREDFPVSLYTAHSLSHMPLLHFLWLHGYGLNFWCRGFHPRFRTWEIKCLLVCFQYSENAQYAHSFWCLLCFIVIGNSEPLTLWAYLEYLHFLTSIKGNAYPHSGGHQTNYATFIKKKNQSFLWLILTGLVFSFLKELSVICKCGKCTMHPFLHGICKVTNKDKFHCLFLCDSPSYRFYTQAMFITYFWSTIKSISGTPCIWCSLLSE